MFLLSYSICLRACKICVVFVVELNLNVTSVNYGRYSLPLQGHKHTEIILIYQKETCVKRKMGFAIIHRIIVTWSPTETIKMRLILFPVFELTVASRQRMTVKKECRSRGDQQMLVLGNLTRAAWHQKEEGRSQTIGWDPKTEVGTPSRRRK